MTWITMLWPMVAGACLTMALIHLRIGIRRRPGDVFKNMVDTVYGGTTDYSKQTHPPTPTAAKPLSAYVGVYRSDYYGQIDVSEDHGLLWMRLPADGSLFTLTHWDGDTFVYRYKEEPGAITRGVKFTLGATPKVLMENLASEGDAVFTKLAP